MSSPRPFTHALTPAQWVARPRWLLGAEALPLLLGEDPRQSNVRLSSFGDEAVGLRYCSWYVDGDATRRGWIALLERDIADGVVAIECQIGRNNVNPGGFIEARWIVPRDAIAWALRNGLPLPATLRSAAEQAFPELFGAPRPAPVVAAVTPGSPRENARRNEVIRAHLLRLQAGEFGRNRGSRKACAASAANELSQQVPTIERLMRGYRWDPQNVPV